MIAAILLLLLIAILFGVGFAAVKFLIWLAVALFILWIIGWVIGPRETIADLWARKDYLTIAPGALSDANLSDNYKPLWTPTAGAMISHRAIVATSAVP